MSESHWLKRRHSLDDSILQSALGGALRGNVDDADLFFESSQYEGLLLDEGDVQRTSLSHREGVGARVLSGERTGYAHTDELDPRRLNEAVRTANAIAEQGNADQSVSLSQRQGQRDLYAVGTSPIHVALTDKIALLDRIDIAARGTDPRVKNVTVDLSVEHRSIVIVRADGLVLHDERPLMRMMITCLVEENGNRQTGRSGGGGRTEFGFFVEDGRWERWVEEAVQQAVVNLDAVEAPAGKMPVVLGPGWPGVLLHEAIGHPLEGDFNRKGTSAFCGMIGQRVATELCTVVDDGTLPGLRGSLNIDDEGTPTEQTVLIEKGILKGYLHDRLNARLMGHQTTGNGRRQSFGHVPMPRMTNTFMLAGESDPADILRSVKRGIYAVGFNGGQVETASGRFVFTANEAYLIEDGKVTAPIRGATLIGNGPEVLKHVSMVGHDLALDEGVGTCGKDGQSVPVGLGLPTVRIDEMTVGGTAV